MLLEKDKIKLRNLAQTKDEQVFLEQVMVYCMIHADIQGSQMKTAITALANLFKEIKTEERSSKNEAI